MKLTTKPSATLATFILMTLLTLLVPAVAVRGDDAVAGRDDDADAPEPLDNINWGTPIHISTTSPAGAFRASLAQSPDGTLLVAYSHVTGGVQNPYFRRSYDGGVTWSAPAPIFNSPHDLRQVEVAYNNNNVAHAVWRDGSTLQHATEGAWPNGADTIITTSDVVLDPALAVGADNVLHVVWAQGSNLHGIHYSRSNDGGATWTTPLALTDDTRHSASPAIAVDGSNNVHVVWEERLFDINLMAYRYEIRYLKGTKSGPNAYNWDANPTVLSPNDLRTSKRPSIIAEGTTVHVSFARVETNEQQYPYYTRFETVSGWTVPFDVSRGHPVSVNSNAPFYLVSSLALCNEGLYIYYHGASIANGKEQIWGVNSVDNWVSRDAVTSPDERNINPSLVCYDGNMQLAYERMLLATVNHQIYFSTSSNVNAIFLPTITLQ
jgi:hypothetical protein